RRETETEIKPGMLHIEANGAPCFDWIGTRTEAKALQKRYRKAMDRAAISALSYAKRHAGYLTVFGMPKPGDPDCRPSAKQGDIWAEDEIAIVRAAILWLALREPVPDTGLKLEDIFVDDEFVVVFEGDAHALVNDSAMLTIKVGKATPAQ